MQVCGGQGSGKTSLLRLILDSSDLSPSATHDQRTAVENFLRGQTRPTELLHAVCAEIAETRTDKVLLSVVDTPGFDFDEGHELKLERQVSEVIKYIDALYAETMGEVSVCISIHGLITHSSFSGIKSRQREQRRPAYPSVRAYICYTRPLSSPSASQMHIHARPNLHRPSHYSAHARSRPSIRALGRNSAHSIYACCSPCHLPFRRRRA